MRRQVRRRELEGLGGGECVGEGSGFKGEKRIRRKRREMGEERRTRSDTALTTKVISKSRDVEWGGAGLEG